MTEISNSDWLSFLGAMLGAALTVLGSVWVINYTRWKRTRTDKANLLSFLAMLEARLQFTKSEQALTEFITGRDVPGLINRAALVLEMTDLLNTPSVAEAATGYRQLYALHKLRRTLKVWSPVFSEYADIPYPQFYTLASPNAFEDAVSKIIVPSSIIRGGIHIYIAEITGTNHFLDEMNAQHGGDIGQWNPDDPYIPAD